MGWINEEGVVELDENGFGVSVWDCLSKEQQEEQMNWTLDKGSSSFDTGEEKESRKVINLYDHSRFEMVSEKDEEVEEEELVNVFDEVEESVDDDELERERVNEEINILNMFDSIGEVDENKYERKQEEYRLKREKREREEEERKEKEEKERLEREEKKRRELRLRDIESSVKNERIDYSGFFNSYMKHVKEVRNLSLLDIAKTCDFTKSSVYRWLKGNNQPDYVRDVIGVIEKEYGVGFRDFVRGVENE